MSRMTRVVGVFTVVLSLGFMETELKATEPDTMRVMTLNIWVGGESGKQPLDQMVKVVQAAQADLVAIQESHGEERNGKKPDAAQAMAEKLSWHYFDQGDEDTGIISRYPIARHTPRKWGAAVELPSHRRVWMFNAHFIHTPYQPYQLLRIPYNDAPFIKTEQEAVAEARAARGRKVAAMLAEVERVRSDNTPIFIAGDFNEPSSLDWTEAVWRAGRSPAAVRWPSTAAMLDAGFLDAYREIHPDPLKSPGFTWTPTTADDDPLDRHDRIDFVFVGGRGAKVQNAEIVGESTERADIVVTPYPTDHRGVVATVTIE